MTRRAHDEEIRAGGFGQFVNDVGRAAKFDVLGHTVAIRGQFGRRHVRDAFCAVMVIAISATKGVRLDAKRQNAERLGADNGDFLEVSKAHVDDGLDRAIAALAAIHRNRNIKTFFGLQSRPSVRRRSFAVGASHQNRNLGVVHQMPGDTAQQPQ